MTPEMSSRRQIRSDRRRQLARVVVAASIVFAAMAPAASAAAAQSVMTYGYGNTRAGYNSAESTLGPAQAGSLHQLWSYDIGGGGRGAGKAARRQAGGGR